MCFVVHEKYPSAKIAKRDIICYKVLRSGLYAIWHPKRYDWYKRNDSIRLETYTEIATSRSFINKGYHSFSSLRETRKFKETVDDEPENCFILVRCIIPKGEVYYFNPYFHEYVSSNIIIKELIK